MGVSRFDQNYIYLYNFLNKIVNACTHNGNLTDISPQTMSSVNCGGVIEIHWLKCWNTDIIQMVAIVENQESMENIRHLNALQ